MPEKISFDHDLGEANGIVLPTGYDFVKWLGEYILDHNVDLSQFTWYVHSQNPVGVHRINGYLENLVRVLQG